VQSFGVTPQELANAANSCTTTAGTVSDQLTSLRSYVTSMEGWWKGIASNTFQELMQEYDIYSNMLHEALIDIGSGLSGNQMNYQDSETANINSINVIQNELGQPKINLN
jgi:WXG100 family type VII secretion target